ncbi:MAG: tetratricopeptide repeat protein [Planctomycetota bacterium]|jgi:tetratricopeptide (TPR) repeat protein
MTTDPNQPCGQDQTPTPCNSDRYEKGLELAEAGKHQEALEYMQEQLRATPDDAEVLNDTGAILHCLGRSDEAIDHISRARSIKNDSAEIVWNLAEAYLAVGRASEAVQLFDQMDRFGVLNADLLNRTADVFLNQHNKADALEMLLRSLRSWPDQELLRPMVEVIRSKRPKVALFGDDRGRSSVGDVAGFVKERFEIRIAEGQSEDELRELMNWSDISWFEQYPDLAVEASKHPKVCNNIVMMRRYEGHEQWPGQMDWANIEVLVVIDDSFDRDALIHAVPDIESQTSLVAVPRAVNVEKFKSIDRQRGKNIALLSSLTAQENPAFALQCMQKLHYIDSEYRLFVAGDFQDATQERYVRHMVGALDLGNVVFFDGWQEDVCAWLQDKHCVVSTGISTRLSTGLLEAMACGLKPVVHNFPGADQLMPSEFLFNISEQFCEQICCEQYEPAKYRRFIEENYPLENQLAQINQVLIRLEAEIESEQADDPSGEEWSDFATEDVGFPAESAVPADGAV